LRLTQLVSGLVASRRIPQTPFPVTIAEILM